MGEYDDLLPEEIEERRAEVLAIPDVEERQAAIKELVIGTIEGPLSAAEEQLLRDKLGYAKSETRTKAERNETAQRMLGRCRVDMDEERYVQHELAQTRAYFDLMVRSPEKKLEGQERLARAEVYARWRYRGWLKGEIASL